MEAFTNESKIENKALLGTLFKNITQRIETHNGIYFIDLYCSESNYWQRLNVSIKCIFVF